MTSIPAEVLPVLSACTFDGAICRLPDQQLDRRLYLATNKVLEGLGGHWDKKTRGHVFDSEDAEGRLDDALLTGTYERTKGNTFDFFPTPVPLARKVVQLARLSPMLRVLEPSAGDGALCDEALGNITDSHCDVWDFICFEIRPDLRRKLLTKGYCLIDEPDFLNSRMYLSTDPVLTPFDRIIMNPPFSKQQDIAHVTEALRYLAPDGLLVAIMSAGITFRMNAKTVALRLLIAERGGSITPNPEGSFKPSGTNVNTCTVVIPGGAVRS